MSTASLRNHLHAHLGHQKPPCISVAHFRISCVTFSLVFTFNFILCACIWFSRPVASFYWRTQPLLSTYEVTHVPLVSAPYHPPNSVCRRMLLKTTSRLPLYQRLCCVTRAPSGACNATKTSRAVKQSLKASAETPGQPLTS